MRVTHTSLLPSHVSCVNLLWTKMVKEFTIFWPKQRNYQSFCYNIWALSLYGIKLHALCSCFHMQSYIECLLPRELLSTSQVFLSWSYSDNKTDTSGESKDQACLLLQASLCIWWASKTFDAGNLWQGAVSTLKNLKKFARTCQMMLRLDFVLICTQRPRNQASNVKEKSINQSINNIVRKSSTNMYCS